MLENKLKAFNPEVVGISLRNMKVGMPGYQGDDFGAARYDRSHQTSLSWHQGGAGGTAFSLYAEAMMKRVPSDYGVWGEAEHRFPELLNKLDTPWEVKGVYYRKGEETVYTGSPPSHSWH